jgi:hypothetical protein
MYSIILFSCGCIVSYEKAILLFPPIKPHPFIGMQGK